MSADSATHDISFGDAGESLSRKWRLRATMAVVLLSVCALTWTLWPSRTYDPRLVGTWTFQTTDSPPQTRKFDFHSKGRMSLIVENGGSFPYRWYVTRDKLVVQQLVSRPRESFLKKAKRVAHETQRRFTGQLPFDPGPEEFRIIQLDEQTCVLESLPLPASHQLILARQAE